ncbi:MAG: adenylate/guanylate cyclase domain-containing protein [Azospirillaceae bacterium]
MIGVSSSSIGSDEEAPLSPRHPALPAVADWLARDAAAAAGVAPLLAGLAGRLAEAGLPLEAAWLQIRVLNPLLAGQVVTWRAGTDGASETLAFHPPDGLGATPRRRDDPPWAAALERAAGSGLAVDFEAEGRPGVALPVTLSDGARHALALLAGAGGFEDHAMREALADIARRLACPLEVLILRDTLTALLETYLGRRSARRVLAGEVRRGSAETVEGVLWVSDLRGFTGLAERLDRDAAVALLDAHFERLVAPIQAFGGEVLKFVGDGLVSIFPVDFGGPARACGRALDAVSAAGRATDAFNAGDRGGLPPIAYGVGLHRGPVYYGNIGSPDRLDFTVIGPTVNRAARIEARCKPTGYTVLASRDVAVHAGDRLRPAGRHRLEGVDGPVDLFTPIAADPAEARRPPSP